jgi:hypothetical protein
MLNSRSVSAPGSPFLQTADPNSEDDDRSAQQPFRLNSSSLGQPTASNPSADEGNLGSGSSAASTADPDDSRSIIRVVRDATGHALAIIHVQPVASAASSESDTTPDALHPGAKYAQINNAETGNPFIDRTTGMLIDVLQQSIQAMGSGWGPFFGTRVHSDFAKRVRQLDLLESGKTGLSKATISILMTSSIMGWTAA